MSGARHSFLSSHTDSRSIVDNAVSLAGTFGFSRACCDIARAFLQSSPRSSSDLYIDAPPPCVVLYTLQWNELVASSPDLPIPRKYGFLC